MLYYNIKGNYVWYSFDKPESDEYWAIKREQSEVIVDVIIEFPYICTPQLLH